MDKLLFDFVVLFIDNHAISRLPWLPGTAAGDLRRHARCFHFDWQHVGTEIWQVFWFFLSGFQ